MTPELLLLSTAAGLGVLHTAVGVDHTLPFIALGQTRAWSLKKTLAVTLVCGLGHVLSSIAVGAVGAALGATTVKLQAFEFWRGNWAANLLIAFGVLYAALGVWRLFRGSSHGHVHVHADGTAHRHRHGHLLLKGRVAHEHHHEQPPMPLRNHQLLPALFVVFLLGPCEALIPLMFAPAASGHTFMPALVAFTFSVATLLTMLTLVAVGYSTLLRTASLWSGFARLGPHLSWVAGVAIALSGVAIEVFGI